MSHPLAKLTEGQIRAIRASYDPGRVTGRMLSEAYGVTPVTISRILRRETCAHLE